MFDSDGDGTVTIEEITEHLDVDHDSKIEVEEFVRVVLKLMLASEPTIEIIAAHSFHPTRHFAASVRVPRPQVLDGAPLRRASERQQA